MLPADEFSIRPRPEGQGKRQAHRRRFRRRDIGGFNPPPARWPGPKHVIVQQQARFKPCLRFQSAPGPMARGNVQYRAIWRAFETGAGYGFNPPPARWPGETMGGDGLRRRPDRFNPPPGPVARETGCWTTAAATFIRRHVSIRPRPSGQGKPAAWRRSLHADSPERVSIRPRGPLARGNRYSVASYGSVGPWTRGFFQSAPGPLARGNSAVRFGRHPGNGQYRQFQSAPGPMARGNATRKCKLAAECGKEFQSAPGPMARGNPRRRRYRRRSTRYGFNPPPARWPGETGRPCSVWPWVSIRPRPDGQGKRRRGIRRRIDLIVSIRPRPDGQGKRRLTASVSSPELFQSAPGPLARGN